TTAGFRYQYHCDGSAFGSAPDYATADTRNSQHCTCDEHDTYPVRARTIDKDNGATAYTTDVVVNNVAPTATLSNDGPVNEGSPRSEERRVGKERSTGETTAGFS